MDLNQITLQSADVSRSLAFYRTLGLQLIVDSAPRYARLVCPDGRTTLSIHQAEGAVITGGVTLYFECEELDQNVTALKHEGITFFSDPVDQPWLWREASLRDPDGHHLILYRAGSNRLDPPWRVR
jgi:catechol 2,3-dioxygenase-like lactoylglutathione lyase family enzyme